MTWLVLVVAVVVFVGGGVVDRGLFLLSWFCSSWSQGDPLIRAGKKYGDVIIMSRDHHISSPASQSLKSLHHTH